MVCRECLPRSTLPKEQVVGLEEVNHQTQKDLKFGDYSIQKYRIAGKFGGVKI